MNAQHIAYYLSTPQDVTKRQELQNVAISSENKFNLRASNLNISVCRTHGKLEITPSDYYLMLKIFVIINQPPKMPQKAINHKNLPFWGETSSIYALQMSIFQPARHL